DLTGRFRIINTICRLYVTVIRGTPVMVQLMIIYYVVFASVNFNPVLIASVAFGLNSGAYVAEVIRSGINAVPKGQMEACRSLGMSNRMAMTTVILPQAVRNILPALGNEGITLLKETSVAGYIGIMDLTRGGDIIRGQTYDALLPMIVVAAIYLAIVLVLTRLINKLEKRLNNAY
ncbi:MAG: amino acid ABC transporter permease, partial [Candidatus Methanomethylophilaceae archaeon]|nr:amino acid ABC transporter permease [Candidatus Methanomethylophilaceae archaeon]